MDTFSVLLVLKDRVDHTQRIMNKLDSEKFPYEILIADGGSDLAIEEELSDKSNFPNLNYTYLRYPFDKQLSDFYKKMSDAVMKIKTSTVCLMDNDDDLNIDGIKKCLEILKDKGYSSARGLMETSSRNMYAQYPDSIIANTAAERMIQQTKHFHGNWHNIARTNHIQAQWKMIEIVSPNNFRITEQITGYLNTIWGNSHRGDFPWMYHEDGNVRHTERIKTEDGCLQHHYPPQEHWINADYWPKEFKKMTEVIGAAISYHDKIPINEALKLFSESYHFKLPHLKGLIKQRINDAKDILFDYNRIDKMFEIMEECQV